LFFQDLFAVRSAIIVDLWVAKVTGKQRIFLNFFL